MVKLPSKTIILTVVTIMTSLTLLLPSTMLKGFSQGLEIPEFKPKPPTATENQNTQSSPSTQNTVKKPSEEIAMKVLLEEHEFLDDYYDVDDFAFVASNTSKLCPSGDCEYEVEDGQMSAASAGEGWLVGKFKVDTGESKKVMNMRADWETVEERETPDGEYVQYIEGDFGVGRDEYSPEHKYKINGTLTTDGGDYILEVKGMK